MERALIFAVMLALTVLYALVRGGTPERLCAIFYTLGYAGSLAFGMGSSTTSSMVYGVVLVDIFLGAALTVLALYANRYWTLWAASLQIVSLGAYPAKLIIPEIMNPAFYLTLIVWSYAAIPVLLLGTHRHRLRLRRFGPYPNFNSNKRNCLHPV